MKIITRAVLDWDGNVLEEESYEYAGPLALGKSSGSSPTPTNPYEQAAAEIGGSEDTAAFNAAINRTNSSNPLGSQTWGVTGYDGSPSSSFNGFPTGYTGGTAQYYDGGYGNATGAANAATGSSILSGNPFQTSQRADAQVGNDLGGSAASAAQTGGSTGTFNAGGGLYLPSNFSSSLLTGGGGVSPTNGRTAGQENNQISSLESMYGSGGTGALNSGSGAPIYSNTTSLTPWANQMLESPIQTYQTVGDQGVGAAAANAQNAAYQSQMSYLQPQQALQSEQTPANLEAQGAMPGSPAYQYGMQQMGQQQTFANQQAYDSSFGAGQSALSNMTNIGTTELQNELATRAAPISEYNSLLTGSSPQVSATSPDLTSAFQQQYQAALAGYNANTATNNANTAAGASLAGTALEAFLAS